MRKSVLRGLALLATGTMLAACNGASEKQAANGAKPKMLSAASVINKEGEASPAARMAIGRGEDYLPIGEDPALLFARLESSMADRRAVGWRIVEAMLKPKTLTVAGDSYEVPLWHTWYEGMAKVEENAEVKRKIQLFFDKVRACKGEPACKKTRDQIADETMADTQARPQQKSMGASLSDANFSQLLNQHKAMDGTDSEQFGTGFTLFSPSFVLHVLQEAKGIEECPKNQAKPDDPPPSDSEFSPCFAEFPRSAVMVKTSWRQAPVENVRTHDTSASAMEKLFANNRPRWGSAGETAVNPEKMYSVQTKEGTIWGLESIHFSTKDTREWLWVSLWWDPQPNTDFGQDRPASIARFGGGVWANYKMCITSSFNERDAAPWKSWETSAPLLSAALKANDTALKRESGNPARVTTWCSNPNLEGHINNHRTNCIGCHQYSLARSPLTGGDTGFGETLRPQNAIHYPQFGRDRKRRNFPADFSWSLSTTVENVPDTIRAARGDLPKE